jgi:ribonuclease BN (tRNA processing enzyme)
MLGTQGGPIPQPSRAQPASLLIVNKTPYLIDAGNGVARQLALAKIPLANIGQIFITHNHDDHNADWGTLMGLSWSLGRRDPITVYGPHGTESMLLGFLQYFAPNVANRTYRSTATVAPEKLFIAHDIQAPGLVYKDANITVSAIENCHYHYREGQPGYGWQQSFSFRFQTPDKVIVFSGDTGPCGNELISFAKGATILVHEVADVPAIGKWLKSLPTAHFTDTEFAELMQRMRNEHSSPEEIGHVALAANVGEVVLSHLVPGGAVLPDSAYSDGVRKFYPGRVIVAHDLMEIH